ncbi:MAG: hypothetical protein HY556_05890 [Euryarchaeota archaeon]|nr:hypothetical protein [Euryarchaeota archaeon]
MRTIYKRYEVDLSLDDVIDVAIRTQRGRVLSFALNYRARIGGAWHEVARYDTCHGYVHLHRAWLPEQDRVTTMAREKRSTRLKVALQEARSDILENWTIFRERVEAALR